MTAVARPAMLDRLKRRDHWRKTGSPLPNSKSLLEAARAGDDEAQLALASQLNICQNVDDVLKAAAPDTIANENLNASLTGQSRNCAVLRELLLDGERAPTVWRDRAANLGNGVAKIQQVFDGSFATAESRKQVLREAFTDRDPGMLTMLISQASLDPTYRADFGKASYDRAFWIGGPLAQCALGTDCSSDGWQFRRFCRNGGTGCDRAVDLGQLFELRLSPAEFQETQDNADRLVHSLEDSMEDSPEAQATLRLIDKPTK